MEVRNRRKNNSHSAAKMLSLLVLLAFFMTMAAIPQEVHAASKSEKYTYSVKVSNINSNTVMKKGEKIRIEYKATKKKAGAVKIAKVKFKSSNKKVATVSKNGVIKAKKKGTTYITVYCKAKKSVKKKIKVRVGTRVTSVKVSGFNSLRKGHSASLKAKTNSGATNKKVSWKSGNTSVATVSSSGKVTARGYGQVIIYATAKDGSKVRGSRTIYVSRYTKQDAKWIAHRGLHTSSRSNTAAAFTAAGKAGFWACECDIWETRKEPDTAVLPEIPAEPEENEDTDEIVSDGVENPGGQNEADEKDGTGDEGEEIPDTGGLQDAIIALPGTAASYSEAHLAEAAVEAAWAEYENLSDGLTDYQKGLIRKAMIDNTGEDLLERLFTLHEKVCGYNSMDLAINHDPTFSNGSSVKKMTKEEIENNISYKVCFLDQFLDICKQYNMVPIIEFKDKNMSNEAVLKAIEIIDAHGMLDEAYLISFYTGVLTKAKQQAALRMSGSEPVTYYLFSSSWSSKLDTAHAKGYTGVSVRKDLLSGSLYSKAKGYGLGVGTWTYQNTAADDNLVYEAVLSGKYALDFVTVDYKIF